MKNILRINKWKQDDKEKEDERQKRRAILMAETGMTFDDDEDDEPKEEEKKGKSKRPKKVEEVDPEELARRQAIAAKAKDIATYGVSHLLFILILVFVAYLDLGRLPRG